MTVTLFLLYILFCIWLFPKITFLKNSVLTRFEIRFLLIIKITLGICCAWYFQKTFNIGDHVSINEEGILHYKLLINSPDLFFSDMAGDFNKYGSRGLFESSYSFWGYLRFTLLFKFVALLNLLTKGNFYFNSVIFSSLVFFGHIAFYRVFSGIYPAQKIKNLLICFLLPSLFLYTACVHKDGFVFLSLALLSYVFYRYLQPERTIKWLHIIVFIAALSTIFLFRNYVLVALFPAMFTSLLCNIFSTNRKWVVGISYAFYTALFFLSGLLKGSFNLPAAVIKRKTDFALLEQGNTDLAMNNLTPDLSGFIGNLPQALDHVLLRPYLVEVSGMSVLLAGLELFFYQFLFILFIFFRNKKNGPLHNFNIYGILFFITMVLIIGYIIPNTGAIVRYRGILWIFVLCPLVCNINWERLKAMVNKRNVST